MHLTKKIFILSILLICLVMSGCDSGNGNGTSESEEYPNKPITFVIPWEAGSALDINYQCVQPFIQEYLGVPTAPEYVPGAGGRIGAAQVYKEKADGYTLLMDILTGTVLGDVLYDADYDVIDMTPICIYAAQPYAVLVRHDSEFNTIGELVEALKKEGNGLLLGIPGVGTSAHFQGEVFKFELGLDFKMIPYEGGAPSRAALIGGEVDFVIATAGAYVAAPDEFKALAVFSDDRISLADHIPTMIESGFQVTAVPNMHGVSGPPNLPKDVHDKLVAAYEAALNDEEVKNRIREIGGHEPVYIGPEEMQELKLIVIELAEQYGDLLLGK